MMPATRNLRPVPRRESLTLTARPVRSATEWEHRTRGWEHALVFLLAVAGLFAVLRYAYEAETALVEAVGARLHAVAAR